MNIRARAFACAFGGMLVCGGVASAALTVFETFEAGEGKFNRQPTFSSSSAGLTTSSTADRVTTDFYNGDASQRLFLDDIVGTNAPDGTAWRVRHLSGDGVPGNNTLFVSDGWIGYYAKTTSPGVRASLMIRDGTSPLERATRIPIPADGQWHLFEWDLNNAAHWDAFAGTGPNGTIDEASVTLDSIYLDAPLTTGDQDAVVFIDDISHDNEGQLPPARAVPEPAAAGLVALLASGMLARRRRA